MTRSLSTMRLIWITCALLGSLALISTVRAAGAGCIWQCELLDLQPGENFTQGYSADVAHKTYEGNEAFYDRAFGESLKGFVLLAAEQQGQAYYVHPDTAIGIYLADGSAAYTLMRQDSLGISEQDFARLEVADSVEAVRDGASICQQNALAQQVAGYVLIRPELHGEAYYVEPTTCLAYYLADGTAAYQAMRFLSLGISDQDLSRLPLQHHRAAPYGTWAYTVDRMIEDNTFCTTLNVERTSTETRYTCTATSRLPDGQGGYTEHPRAYGAAIHLQYNTVELFREEHVRVSEVMIDGTSYMDIPFIMNQLCVGSAWQAALTARGENLFSYGSLIPFDRTYTESQLNVPLARNMRANVYETTTLLDEHDEPIASCTYPVFTEALLDDYGRELNTLEPYKDLITFQVFQDTWENAGGYVIGDLESGQASNHIFYPWYVENYWDNMPPHLDMPPWIDPTNEISTYIDGYQEAIEVYADRYGL